MVEFRLIKPTGTWQYQKCSGLLITTVQNLTSKAITCYSENFIINIIGQVIDITGIFVYMIPNLSDTVTERNRNNHPVHETR